MDDFPEGFIWGTAASAYQTEGGCFTNDWYRMEQEDLSRPESERHFTDPCGAACDHWNRYREDYDLASEMGIGMHRLSVEWSRIFPEADSVDPDALAHYRSMMTALKDRGIRVMLCLHHFTIPLWLERSGGFVRTHMILKHFRSYARTVVESLGDLVDYWLPINEPNVVPLGGYLTAFFPPYRINPLAFSRVYRTFFGMHTVSYEEIKKVHPDSPVGVAFAYMHFRPWNPRSVLDRLGTRLADYLANGCFFRGVRTGRALPPIGFGERLSGLKGSMDFVGLNYYSSSYQKGFRNLESRQGDLVTDMGWVRYPEGLRDCLHTVADESGLPIIVTENGVATTDEAFRIEHLELHLREIILAIDEGVDVRGYMHWSLTDNFEWDKGYRMRFGLVEVDFRTQERRIKESGRWFAEVIRRNGLEN